MPWIWHSLYEAAAMFWEVLWALVLGFAISALLQVFVSKDRMTREFGVTSLRSVALATALGAASSSCSYAAAAAARTAFKKGAALVPTLAFMLASTNLVFELGIVLWLLMGWRFVLAEFVGAFALIAIMGMLARLTLPAGLEDEARAHREPGMEHEHDHGMHGERGRLARVADAFAMDWSMLWKEMAAGFMIAGFLAVLVPNSAWQALFLAHGPASPWRTLENVIVGPIIAILSFVCSVGNIPLASILWSGGISFGGVIAFIYADLIVVPLIVIYRKYYGGRMALYITLVLFASMVLSGLIVDLLFRALHLAPSGPRPASPVMQARFAWNYTAWLDIAALIVAGFLAVIHSRGRAAEHARGGHMAHDHGAHHGHGDHHGG
jgi:uncharacterized membrane protein YraQ (UPF0718 family)